MSMSVVPWGQKPIRTSGLSLTAANRALVLAQVHVREEPQSNLFQRIEHMILTFATFRCARPKENFSPHTGCLRCVDVMQLIVNEHTGCQIQVEICAGSKKHARFGLTF